MGCPLCIVQGNAKDVETCIEEAPADRRDALVQRRRSCLRVLKGFEEGMAYGGPSYSRRVTVEVGFASQRNYISLCILRLDALATQRKNLKGLSVGKGCIRYTRPAKIDF